MLAVSHTKDEIFKELQRLGARESDDRIVLRMSIGEHPSLLCTGPDGEHEVTILCSDMSHQAVITEKLGSYITSAEIDYEVDDIIRITTTSYAMKSDVLSILRSIDAVGLFESFIIRDENPFKPGQHPATETLGKIREHIKAGGGHE